MSQHDQHTSYFYIPIHIPNYYKHGKWHGNIISRHQHNFLRCETITWALIHRWLSTISAKKKIIYKVAPVASHTQAARKLYLRKVSQHPRGPWEMPRNLQGVLMNSEVSKLTSATVVLAVVWVLEGVRHIWRRPSENLREHWEPEQFCCGCRNRNINLWRVIILHHLGRFFIDFQMHIYIYICR